MSRLVGLSQLPANRPPMGFGVNQAGRGASVQPSVVHEPVSVPAVQTSASGGEPVPPLPLPHFHRWRGVRANLSVRFKVVP